jgi:hypothetical protein
MHECVFILYMNVVPFAIQRSVILVATVRTTHQLTHSFTLGTLKQILIFLLHFSAGYLLHKRASHRIPDPLNDKPAN